MNGYASAGKPPKFNLPRMSNTVEYLVDKIQIVKETAGKRSSMNSIARERIAGEMERWSWKVLKEEFKTKDSGRLFEKYQSRIQHTFFMVLLMLNIFFNAIAIVVYFFDKKNMASFPGSLLIRVSALLVFIVFFITTCFEEVLFRPKISRAIAAITVLTAMLFEEYGGALFSLSGDRHFSLQRIRPTFYLIISNHILLPFPSRIYSCLATVLIVGIELGLTFNQRTAMQCESQFVPKFAIADLFFYGFSAIFGLYMTFLLEIAIRRAFMNHRSCVESTFKLDYEQEQQEQLLNSCLPRHLTDRVRTDIRNLISKIARHEMIPQRPFNKLYVEKYKDVSILYADIVNSMLLAASLSPSDLVETLNELFGRFDECAENNNCLRIKLLGDCYYCVSGVPDKDKNHAINCVRMGLDMIKIIRTVREDRELNVDMRIGVHSGMVLSGLIGVHKWQFDIWSIDSMIASSMEHNGKPGYVHVTKTTLDLITAEDKTDFIIFEKPNEDGETGYLIGKREDRAVVRKLTTSPRTKRKKQTDTLKAQINKFRRRSSFESIPICHRQTILENSLRKYQHMVKSVNNFMDSAIEEMPLSLKTQWCHPHGIHPFFMLFTSSSADRDKSFLFEQIEPFSTWRLEWDFAQKTDPFYSFYLFCAGALCITMMAIKLIIPQLSLIFVHKLGFVVTLFIICLTLFYTYYKSHQLSFYLRVLIWFVISTALLACSMMDLIIKDCSYLDIISSDNSTSLGEIVDLARCAYSWDYTLCIILAMTGTSLFIRINVWLKLFMHIVGVVSYMVLFFNQCSIYEIIIRRTKEEHLWISSIGFNPRISHIYYVVMVAVLLHIIDRQIEYIFRLDFQWTNRLVEERLEAETMGEINRILLENILPVHVAQRYLYNSSVSTEELYHESYESCAVMFASIPNYTQFYCETILNEEGLKCLQLLNEIICYFDQMLSHVDFQRIEKIKTIGSTYMAAAGLQPGRGSNDSEVSIEDITHNVVVLVRFASALMETLQRINKDALQDFKLRVGIAVGPVVAGVVGAVKPQYDIWGDTVNVASRMDSTGIMGRIQMTREAANILENSVYAKEFTLEPRGPIMVKGKGELVTYLVRTQFDFDEDEVTRV